MKTLVNVMSLIFFFAVVLTSCKEETDSWPESNQHPKDVSINNKRSVPSAKSSLPSQTFSLNISESAFETLQAPYDNQLIDDVNAIHVIPDLSTNTATISIINLVPGEFPLDQGGQPVEPEPTGRTYRFNCPSQSDVCKSASAAWSIGHLQHGCTTWTGNRKDGSMVSFAFCP